MPPNVRRRILDATLDLIGKHGISGVSNRVVAKAAGVSLGTLTYHFATQSDLLSEALQLFVDDEVQRLAAVAAELNNAVQPSLDRVLQNARRAIEGSTGRSMQIAQLELYLHATRNAGLREAAIRCYRTYDELAATALRALGIPEPERLAPLFSALIDGLELRRLAAGPPAVDLAEGLAALVTGLADRASEPS